MTASLCTPERVPHTPRPAPGRHAETERTSTR